MCTLAGYVGTKQAAPTLLEMAKRQEGLWSGYYSGLATISENKLYSDKLVGSMSDLAETTNALSFPGTIGLIHSRTGSGGDKEWGHPFTVPSQGIACVAQGSHGCFDDNTARSTYADTLVKAGFSFSSATKETIGKYPTLPDGCTIHSSEINTIGFAHEYGKTNDPLQAIRNVHQRILCEAVYLFASTKMPEKIFVANFNQRLVIAKDSTGTYCASSSLAFPDSISWKTELPANTLATISKDEVILENLMPLSDFQVDETIPAHCDTACLEYIRENPGVHISEVVDNAIKPLNKDVKLCRRAVIGYQTMERLLKSNLIRLETIQVTGMHEGLKAQKTIIYPV